MQVRRAGGGPSAPVARSYRSGAALIENPEMLLRLNGHVGHIDRAAHEGRPRLFRDRLKLGKIPKLLLLHLDLGDVVFQNPSTENTKPAPLGVFEHHVRKRLPHGTAPFVDAVQSDTDDRRATGPSRPTKWRLDSSRTDAAELDAVAADKGR